MNTKEILISSLLLALALGLIGLLISFGSTRQESQEQDTPSLKTEGADIMKDVNDTTPQSTQSATPPAQQAPQANIKKVAPPSGAVLTKGADYKLVIKTNFGQIYIDLYEDVAPRTVTSFVYLTRLGFYDGLIFHRVIPDFMVQGGDPSGNGTGGPGYTFEDEFNSRPLIKGSVAMANSGPDTNGSQFFIVTADATPWLNGKHTNFGEVTAGLDVVEKIANVKRDKNDKPLTPVIMERVIVLEDR